MPFLRSSTRPQAVECFFCLSPSLLPPVPERATGSADRKGKGRAAHAEVGTRWNWHCERCGCWNVRDDQGNMLSDHPAMHNSQLNKQSFSLRGRPSSSRLPSTSSSNSSTFCHNCLTNQTLIMNLLANYLPDDDDPTFPSLYAALPSYLESLHARYPPVCASCQPAVDDALRRSDQRAQTEAWGNALRRGAAPPLHISAYSWLDIAVWRARGVLFCLDAGACWTLGVTACVCPEQLLAWARGLLRMNATAVGMIAHLVSILWIAWDPYWMRRVKSDDGVRVSGRATWVRNMLLVLLLRFGTAAGVWWMGADDPRLINTIRAAFVMDLALFLHALFNLRVDEPVALKLIRPVSVISPSRPTTHSATQSRPTSPPVVLQPSHVNPPSNPVFGRPSLQRTVATDDDKMDWEPTPPPSFTLDPRPRPPGLSDHDFDANDDTSQLSGQGGGEHAPSSSDWDRFATGKQSIFPRNPGHDETGLENLLAGWGITTDSRPVNHEGLAQMQLHDSNRSAGMVIDEPFVQVVRVCLVTIRVLGAAITLWSARAAPSWALVSPGIGRPIIAMEAATSSLSLVLSGSSPPPLASSASPQPLVSPRLWFSLDLLVRVAALFGPPLLELARASMGMKGGVGGFGGTPGSESVAPDWVVGVDRWGPAWTWCAWAVLDLVSVLVVM